MNDLLGEEESLDTAQLNNSTVKQLHIR